MTQLILSYFDFDGGRGQPARLAMHIGGITYQDRRVKMADFPEVRKTTPLFQLPILEVDGVIVTQSDAITRYVGKLAGLYPTDAYQALLCDEVMSAAEDVGIKLGASFDLKGDALAQARQALAEGPLPLYLGWLQKQLQAAGGTFFADGRLTIADLKVFILLGTLMSGQLDHIPTDLVQKTAPQLVAYVGQIAGTAAISQYYAARQA